MNNLAVIDGDVLAYKASAACETRSIECSYEMKYNLTFSNRTEFKKHLAVNSHLPPYDEWDVVDIQTPQPIEYCLHTIKSIINNITNACDTDSYVVCISGKNNFRLNIPLPTKYKSNRKDNIRPILLEQVKEYLITYHGAEVSDGCEADDMLAMYCHKGLKEGRKTIACTIDKDQRGVEGWWYNWDKMEKPELIKGFGEIKLDNNGDLYGVGRVWLYAQSLVGDAADGYKPCELSGKKFGEMGCYKLLHSVGNDKEALTAIYEQYCKWYPNPVTYTAWDGVTYTKDAIDIWQMYFDCARMLRYENDKIELRSVLIKQGVV